MSTASRAATKRHEKKSSMEKRELYKQKYDAQIAEWGAKIYELKAHTEKLTAQARLASKPHFDALHLQFAVAKAKAQEIAIATDDKWDDVTKGADTAWQDVKAAVQGAYDALKPHEKN